MEKNQVQEHYEDNANNALTYKYLTENQELNSQSEELGIGENFYDSFSIGDDQGTRQEGWQEDKETYQKVPNFSYLAYYKLKIEKHTIVDEKNPFVLFAIEIQSDFSKYIVLKQFHNFIRLQQDLVKLRDSIVEIHRKDRKGVEYLQLEKQLPKLPSTFMDLIWQQVSKNKKEKNQQYIARQKENLSKYSTSLLELLKSTSYPQLVGSEEEELEEAYQTCDKINQSPYIDNKRSIQYSQAFHQNSQWMNVIANFFELDQMRYKEQQSAIKIQQYFKKFKKLKQIKKLLKYVYMKRGYTVNLMSVSKGILINVVEYLTPKEKIKYSYINKEIRKVVQDPCLWREITIFSRQQLLTRKFQELFRRSSQLRILSLKFCPHASPETMTLIAEECNPFFLRELYLDGCDKINDNALLCLTQKQTKRIQKRFELSDYLNNGDMFLHNFSSIAINQEDMNDILKDFNLNGAAGLEVISLSECRNIQDQGVGYLGNLKYLAKVNLLGCANVKDEGVREIAHKLKYLEEIDIGGTLVSSDSLRDLVTYCLNLRKVNISGCKKLNASDDNILRVNKINYEGGEDVFRFYLVPEQFSDLPRITTSVLKTRSTLSLHKVYKYLIKKLQTDHVLEDINEDQPGDTLVEILCNGVVLNPYIQLKIAKEKYWHISDALLILHYRRKDVANDQESPTIVKEYIPKKPPMWIPDHLSMTCLKCEKEFNFFKRIHHCRNCGRCFCNNCSNNWCCIKEFGYDSPVRVCIDCKQNLQQRLNITYY